MVDVDVDIGGGWRGWRRVDVGVVPKTLGLALALKMTPPEQGTSDTQTQTLSCPSTEKTTNPPLEMVATADVNQGTVSETSQHLPILLEMTLRLHLNTPSIVQSPISEALRLARQGLQAVQQCLPNIFVPLSSNDASSSRPRSGSTESESSTILACILLMDKVLLCYESLLKRRSGPGSSIEVSSPSAPSPAPSSTSTSNPSTSSNHRMQPIFIGDFEVQGKASWRVILDAVVQAEKQEAKNTVTKLEAWAGELVGRRKNEGHLAMTFLEPLRQRFRD
ncbi:hypothetical protein EG329_008459 [Mollisiaceae sp. DMI_Dod_QoI]|nr:hypothetical protein EG329_008459 [Helotiales sp. DMI_Dod_QoI]